MTLAVRAATFVPVHADVRRPAMDVGVTDTTDRAGDESM